MKYCSECGSECGSNDVFCSKCGTKVKSKSNSNTDKDKTIKADLKVEVTNATTEKAFKKVGEAVDSGKEVVKTTGGIVKKVFIPAVILLIIAGVVLFMYDQQQREKRAAAWEQTSQRLQENRLIEDRNRLIEERSCVIQEFKHNKSVFGNKIDTNTIWGFVKSNCDLTYIEVESYQKQLGMKLEKL